MFEKIISLENLFFAWREFKRGKISKLDIQNFQLNLEDNIFELHNQLADKTYRHSPYQSFYVTDPKLRHIHKACVRDRIVHHALFRILYPIFDRGFVFDSYSCRVGKGTHRGVKRLEKFCRVVSKNYHYPAYALKCDVKKFFDSIDHVTLRNLIDIRVKDADTLWLINAIINSFEKSPGRGLPLGNVTSQLFANIYLNELDQFMKHNLKIQYYLRYCDDFIIVSKAAGSLEKLIPIIGDFLNNRLELSLHPNKIFIRKLRQGIDFLGYVVLPYHRVLRTKTKKRIFRKLIRNNNLQSLQSYLGVLKHCNGYKIKKELTHSRLIL